MIRCGHEICRNLDAALRREWLETNGLGGFASSTIAGLNTRRYHGLPIAATNPPVGRLVLLSKLDETFVVDGRRFELSANQYAGVVHPQGYRYLKGFRLDPFPVFTYEVAGVEIEKSVFMIHGENSTVIHYELRAAPGGSAAGSPVAPERCQLEVRPLIAFRDYHGTTHENEALNPHVQIECRLARIAPYKGLPQLHVAHDADEIDAAGYWYRHFEYERERERGLDFVEDLFSPFALRFDVSHRAQATIIASTARHDIRCVAEYRRVEIRRRKALVAASPAADELTCMLVAAADQFIATPADQQTIIAGYHWFTDWGRDTMIALPGLTLLIVRADVAKGILLGFARHVDRGMLPNRFPDVGEQPDYNTVDATLWFFQAVWALWQYTNDYEFIRANLYGVLAEIIDWHVRGTRYGIHMDEGGLLASGQEGVQLTWMDAKVGDWVVTPQRGKPVEIQALWYNALRVMEQLAHAFDDEAGHTRYGVLAARAHQSFNQVFWNEAAECLYDVVDGDRRDGSIRPNQIFAVSLPYALLPSDHARRVIEVTQRELLTPYGLRTLAPSDPRYRGRCEGDQWSRDTAYHQGSVWPWLLGPFITAYIKVHGGTRESRAQAAQWLSRIREQLGDAGLGQVSEIFDGDAPHHPRGCIAQAWSVAELLRAMVEEVLNPKLTTSEAAVARQPKPPRR